MIFMIFIVFIVNNINKVSRQACKAEYSRLSSCKRLPRYGGHGVGGRLHLMAHDANIADMKAVNNYSHLERSTLRAGGQGMKTITTSKLVIESLNRFNLSRQLSRPPVNYSTESRTSSIIVSGVIFETRPVLVISRNAG